MAGHGHEVALIQQWIEHGLQFINLQIPRIHGGDEMLFPSPGMQEVVDPDPDACCVFLESVSLRGRVYFSPGPLVFPSIFRIKVMRLECLAAALNFHAISHFIERSFVITRSLLKKIYKS